MSDAAHEAHDERPAASGEHPAAAEPPAAPEALSLQPGPVAEPSRAPVGLSGEPALVAEPSRAPVGLSGEPALVAEPSTAPAAEPALSWAELFVDRTTTERAAPPAGAPLLDPPPAVRREVAEPAVTEAVPVATHRPADAAPPAPRRAPFSPFDEEEPLAPPRRREVAEPGRRTPADVVERPAQARPRPPRDARDVRAVRGVRSRRLVRRIDVVTVFKVSVAFYLLALVTLIIAGFVVWNVADVFGLIKSLQNSIRTLFSLKTFTLHSGSVLFWSVVIGGVLCVVGALLTTMAATIYNLLSDVVGGIEVVVVSDGEADPRR